MGTSPPSGRPRVQGSNRIGSGHNMLLPPDIVKGWGRKSKKQEKKETTGQAFPQR